MVDDSFIFKHIMVQLRTVCTVRDNTGVKMIRRIQITGMKTARAGSIGAFVVASVIKAMPKSTFKKGDVVRAYLVTSTYGRSRPSGITVRFPLNGCVLVNKKRDPIGTRILSVLPSDLRRQGRSKLLSLSTHVS
jgi:large subunit ribosomal protein L14